jgi:hypothetical protein
VKEEGWYEGWKEGKGEEYRKTDKERKDAGEKIEGGVA